MLLIRFLLSGFDGSMDAFLSYEPSATQGHIWFIDKERTRDCKGEWLLNSNKEYSWKIKCQEGLKAAGEMTNPLRLSGDGRGKDSFEREVPFIFTPFDNPDNIPIQK